MVVAASDGHETAGRRLASNREVREMTDPNAALREDLDMIRDTLPGKLVRLRLTWDSKTFEARKCYAWFEPPNGEAPIGYDIPLAAGFDVKAWVTTEYLPHMAPVTMH